MGVAKLRMPIDPILNVWQLSEDIEEREVVFRELAVVGAAMGKDLRLVELHSSDLRLQQEKHTRFGEDKLNGIQIACISLGHCLRRHQGCSECWVLEEADDGIELLVQVFVVPEPLRPVIKESLDDLELGSKAAGCIPTITMVNLDEGVLVALEVLGDLLHGVLVPSIGGDGVLG